MKSVIIFIIIIVLIILFLFGCGTARKTEPILEPVQLTDSKLIEGEKSFYRFCSSCHPHGEAGLGPALNNKNIVPGFLIKFQVRNGLGKMPSFSDNVIPSEELDNIVKYIKYLQGRG
jgi:mono/diheme cytochrome c family protein